MTSFTWPTKAVTFAELLKRNEKVAGASEPLPYLSEVPSNAVFPTIAIFACSDFRYNPEELFQVQKGEAFIIRNAGGNVKPYIHDVLFLETLLNNGLKEIIIIHHEDCGTTRVTPQMIKDNVKAKAPKLEREIDGLEFHMHDGQNLEDSVRRDLQFLRESPYIRKELSANSKGFVFYFKTNKLVEVK